MDHQIVVNNFFQNIWKYYPDPLYFYEHSSPFSLNKKISDNESILDVGCGKNLFKTYFNNVIGIDPVYTEADVITTIENFSCDTKFDVALCLSSINYGTEMKIDEQIRKVVSLLKPKSRIYWRLVPHYISNDINIFPWTHNKLRIFAELHGYIQCNEQIENSCRYYAEWHR